MFSFEPTIEFARRLDSQDPLGGFRERFHLPLAANGTPAIYLVGNSTGLQPRKTKAYVEEELNRWAKLGAEAHFTGDNPWYSYHETVTGSLARITGAKPGEVVAMNGLSVNLQLMLASFYMPSGKRYRIAMEAGAFPSDRYAVELQARFRGVNAKDATLEISPRSGETTLRTSDILELIDLQAETLALILLGHPNYLTGQAFDIPAIVTAAAKHGILVGLDLAHGVGNLKLSLHDWGIDFAVWCSYKYLNSGPGAIGGCFVHEKHANDYSRPRLAAWWGHDKQRRFLMEKDFVPMPGAEGYQLSNPPILQLAALRASLEIFDEVGMERIGEKSERLTGYLEYLVDHFTQGELELVTPRDTKARGAQLSWRLKRKGKSLVESMKKNGVVCDFREPDILRVAPIALYNSYSEMYRFAEILGHVVRSELN